MEICAMFVVGSAFVQKAFQGWSSDDDSYEKQEVDPLIFCFLGNVTPCFELFEKPHEVVSKTYKEPDVRTGDIQFDLPVKAIDVE
jgi:hypothetical protein